MSKFNLVSLLTPLLFIACGDDTAGADPTDDVCPVHEPSRLIAAPDDWEADEYELNFQNTVVDDRLLYSFAAPTPNWAFGDVFLRDLCGGEPELVLAAERGIQAGTVLEFPQVGKVLYGFKGKNMYVVDRLDEPGADTPKPVAGLPLDSPQGAWVVESRQQRPLFVRLGQLPADPDGPRPAQAAGIGAATRMIVSLGATPDAPALQLGDDIVNYFDLDDRLVFHADDGRVFLYDPITTVQTPLVDNARWVGRVSLGDRRFLLIQDIGDDQSEQVCLVDLATDQQRPVTVNDFTQASFGRAPKQPRAGTWTGHSYAGRAVIALNGPDGGLSEAYDVATLDPLELPDNRGAFGIAGAPWMPLILPDAVDTVLAAWDPGTGAVTEWYRGPRPAFLDTTLTWNDGKLEYTEEVSREIYRDVQRDLASGETTVVLPRRGGQWYDLEDGRVLTAFALEDHDYEVKLIDRATAAETTLVPRTRSWSYDVDQALVLYTDFVDAEPGLWATPIPTP